jgi:hypothetical protein
MSVPLDRLYNHLDGLCNHDILIYRFYPHGSKKLDDLLPLSDNINNQGWQWLLKSGAICHDQEPLFFDQYSNNDMMNQFLQNPAIKLNSDILGRIESAIKHQHLRCIIDSQYSVYDTTLLIHSEKNSINLDQYVQAGFIGVYWWAHAAISCDWFRYAQHDAALKINFDSIDKDFLIYNRAWSGTREYRLKFSELVVNNNLQMHSVMRFNTESEGNNYQTFTPVNPAFKIQRTDLENHFDSCLVDATASADYNNNDYQHTAIEVVLETLFDDTRLHLTEKSLRPIACGRPFMLASAPGSLEYLRSYGFKTFDGYIDETYDTVQDPLKRLVLIVNEMKRISQLSAEQKRQLWQNLYAIADYNKKLFFDQSWQQSIFNEFVTNARSALAMAEHNKTGKYWRAFYNAWRESPEKFNHIPVPGLIDSMFHAEEIEQLLGQQTRLSKSI